MEAQQLIAALKATTPSDAKTILKLIGNIKEDGLLDSLLGDRTGSNGIALTKDQAKQVTDLLANYGYYDSNKKAAELLHDAVKVLRIRQALTPELEIVREQAEAVIANGGTINIRHTMKAYEAYESWLHDNDWFRYEIQHAIVCLNTSGTLAGGTRMIIENKIGKITGGK